MNSVQNKIIGIFKTVAEICRRHDIRYFAIGGTCIGAVRHNGFIPWDDDLDIAVPIEQYFELMDILAKELPDNLKLYTCNEVKHYDYYFAKVHDTDTAFIEDCNRPYQESYKGIFIDIMPISGLPADPEERRVLVKKLYRLDRMNVSRRFWNYMDCSGMKSIIKKVFHVVSCVLPYTFFTDKIYDILKKYPLSDSEYTGYVWWPSELDELTFRTADFMETVEFPFEDTLMACPAGYDDFLSEMFGDYMQLPPEKDRVRNHSGIVDPEHSYRDYL